MSDLYKIILEDGSILLNTKCGQTAFGWVNHESGINGEYTGHSKIIPWHKIKEIIVRPMEDSRP